MASAELKDPPVSGQDVQGDIINHSRQASRGTMVLELASPLACLAPATDHRYSAPCSYRCCRRARDIPALPGCGVAGPLSWSPAHRGQSQGARQPTDSVCVEPDAPGL